MIKIILLLSLVFVPCFSEGGGENWGYESNGFDWAETCKTGVRQSPININKDEVGNCKVVNPSVSLTFKNATVSSLLKVVDNTLRDSFNDPIAFFTAPDLNGVTQSYVLSNFHFHTFSEHQINSVQHKLEMHMVFKSSSPVTNDSYAVVGVMFEPTTTLSLMQKKELDLLSILNFKYAEEEEHVNFAELFEGLLNAPGNKFFHYKGSLTTPPCSEVVNWYVLDRVIHMNADDFKPYYDYFFAQEFSHHKGNFRVTQNLNGRTPCYMQIPNGNTVNLYLGSQSLRALIALFTFVFAFIFLY